MNFLRLCNWVCSTLVDQLLQNNIQPHDKSCLGKANLDGRFGGLIVWNVRGTEVENRFRIMVVYEGEAGQPKKPSAVEVTFLDKDPHRLTSQVEFKDPNFQEWITACIKS